ncbi:sensor histidine kinase [Massilia niabensis]|uniref:histidine kinase n=1 Tax=Massilia niabensis TaxID=544910 RepID=A0ABW0L6B8_9BURK
MRIPRQDGLPDGPAKAVSDARDAADAAELLSLTQNQMLVNQALIEKILALQQAEEALRASEQKLHELLAHQLATREDERKRISQELHNSLGQNLLALRIDIVMLHQHTTKRHYRLRDRIGSALDNVDITLRTVKELMGELRPSGLELGLHATVEWELRKFGRASGIACELGAGPGIPELVVGEEEVLTVHRVLQECLNNVFRHSLASRVNVRLDSAGDRLSMRIIDNGIGFDPAAPRKPSSFGLLDLHERVAGHGGELIVKRGRTHGTEVTLSIPIAPACLNASAVHTIG